MIREVNPYDGNELCVFVVAEYLDETPSGAMAFRFIGVASDVETAEEWCTTPQHFVGPCLLGVAFPDPDQWPGQYYPRS
jgi:hypothetical protein